MTKETPRPEKAKMPPLFHKCPKCGFGYTSTRALYRHNCNPHKRKGHHCNSECARAEDALDVMGGRPVSEKAHSPLPCDMESILIAAGISKADAQYACVAVNLHSQLVEALEKIEKVTGDFTRDGKYLGDQRCLWIYEVAKEALRSAKGIERE